MFRLRALLSGAQRNRIMFTRAQSPITIIRKSHDDRPPRPLENLPFTVPNRYGATLVWILFFGSGLWAPYLILWYSMAKRTF